MDYRGISHTVDRTGTCRLWEQQLMTSRVILIPEHGTEILATKFSTFLSLSPCIYLKSPKVRNRRIV